MGKGKNFNDFTYGVGLEVNATSFKQVKDDLKLNLDSLSKMVKSYGKVLKIDPNADLSKLFEEMRKIQSIVDGINGSDNSFSGFVDKGTLGRIAELENGLQTVSSISKETKAAMNDLQNSITQMLEPLKSSGEIKLPGTFNELFSDAKNKTSEIKNVTQQLKELESEIQKINQLNQELKLFSGKIDGKESELGKDASVDEIKAWLNEYETLVAKLKDKSSLGAKELSEVARQTTEVCLKLRNAFSVDSNLDKFSDIDGNFIFNIASNMKKAIGILKENNKDLQIQRQSLRDQLKGLNADQAEFNTKGANKLSGGKSLGIMSDITGQVNVTPKVNASEWATIINNVIRNIESKIIPVKLTPTFSNSSKNLEKEVNGNLAQINHAVNVDLKVTDNLKNFTEKIQNIDKEIKAQKKTLEETGSFKIKFDYEDGGKLKEVAQKVIKQFKQIDAKLYISNGKKFILDVIRLKEKAQSELKNIPANIDVTNQDSIFSGVDTLRAEINEKIGNIGVNLTLQNIPQFMAQAAMMRDSVEQYYNNHPIGSIVESGSAEIDVENTTKSVVELSDKAKDAQSTIEKIKNTLKSLSEVGFKSDDFLKLGAFDENLKYVKGSKEKVQQLLQEYEELYSKVYASKDELRATYGANDAGYAAYREDLNILQQMETMLNAVLQSQIQYTQSRLESTEKILAKEMQIVETKKEQSRVDSKNSSTQQSTQQLGMSAEEATKKIRSLNGTLTQQKKVLKDLETNKFDASSFAKLGEWDKETNSFKKNSQEIKQLINRYKELREARIASGGKTATGEEASIRGKLAAILREQKKHVVEIINKNQAELESVKQISAAYKEAGNSKSKAAKTKVNTDINKHIDELTTKLKKAKETLELLKSKGLDALSSTGLKDPNKYLESIGSKQNFNDLIKLYNDLIAKKKELEKVGKTDSAEYKQYEAIYQDVEKHMQVIYQDQLKYTQLKINELETEISKEKEILQLKAQQTKEDAKQSGSSSNNKTNVKTGVASTTVKLDGATLNSLAKDTTLKAIDGKINNIVSQLGKGIVINGSNISIEASNVSVSGNDTKGVQATSKSSGGAGGKQPGHKTAKETAISSQMRQLVEFEERAKRSEVYSDTLKKKFTDLRNELAKVSTQDDVDAYKVHLDKFKAEFAKIKTFKGLYDNLVKSKAKQLQLIHEIENSTGSAKEAQEELRLEQEKEKKIEAHLKQCGQLYTQRTQELAVTKAIQQANQEIAKTTMSRVDKTTNKQNSDLAKIVTNAQDKLNEMKSGLQNLTVPAANPAIEKVRQYEQLLTVLQKKQREVFENPDLLKDKDYSDSFMSLLQQMQKVQVEFEGLHKSSEILFKNIKNSEDIKVLDSTVNINNLEQMHDVMQEFANQAGVGAAKLIEFNDTNRTATFEVKNGRGQVQQLTVAYDAATNSLGRYAKKTKDSVSETSKFIASLKQSFQNVARYVASFGSVYRVFAMLKQGVTYVKDIDSALTELKKVTDETDASYDKFLQDMSKTASVVGSTVSELTTMAAEWARLGYSMKEAGQLAESTAVLLNVSEFEDATKASEALISTMQAFSYTADESQHVVDILNEVGNNFAVSSDGIATALQDSASALMEGGNNLEQAVAMVAAANKVVQDPNSVGSALRTISLRLRGTSLEVLKEMGEETDGVIESTSKLQAKIKALTGVDILTESGAYKETYTILAEIGQVWEDMADIDQAALLELMAGKNRANTLAAILGNMDDLKGAYESALNAEGSALKENESYLDSIQGRLDLFTNSVQTMWMNTLGSETVKDFVSFGTALIELVDKFGLLETALAGIATYFTTFSKNKIDLASMLGIHNLDKTFFKGFSAIGKQGLTGWVANLFKGKTVGNQITEKIFDPDSLRVSAADFAAAIQNNIDDYVTIDTTKIDSEIEGIQHKLQVARKQLDDARSRDWKYYKTMGSKTPAKDKNNAIDEKVNEINRLENELLELQRTRDDIVNSAVSNVATSMSTSIDNDVKSYKSMLSVLSEVKDTKLYLGDEQYAAQQIDLMSQAAQNGQLSLAGYVSSLDDADIALKAYAASVQDGNYSLAGFQQFIAQHNAQLKASGVAAKAAAVGHTILNAALSMGISLLVSSVFSFVIEKLGQIGEYAQRAAEAVNTYNDEQKKLNSQKKTVDELAKSYQKLSSGVNTATNDNIGLTTESYEEYLGVCNDIADMFPELIAGYDAEGNAILTLKGKVDSLTDAYENMAKASSAKFLTQDNKEDIWKSYNKAVNQDVKKKWYGTWLPAGTKPEQQATLDFLDKLTNADFEHLLSLSDGINSIFASDTKEAYGDKGKFLDFLAEKGYSGNVVSSGKFTNFLNDVGLDFEDIAEQIENGDITLTEGINTLRSNISVALSNVNADIAAAMSDIKQTVSAKLLWDPDYQDLDDNTKEMLSTIVNNLNPDMIAQMGATSIDDVVTILMSDLKDADNDIVEGIYDIQNDIAKAIAGDDVTAFSTAKANFENLIPDDWRDGANKEIVIDENADAVTQFLQRTAKEIENQSKNYEIKLQFKADYESSLAKSPENDYDKDYATKAQEAERIVKAYNDAVTGLGQLGFDSTQTVFGNIDTNNRHVLEWTEENLNKYRSIIESWGQNVDDYVDSYSTVLGSLGTFEGVEIAFSPMLQTSEGAVLLDSNTVNKYIFDLIDKVRMDDGAFDAAELFALDAEGLDIEGTYIHGLIAAVGDEAEAISQAMHFTGTDGAITVGWDMIAEAAEKAGVSVEQYVAAVQNANWEQIGIDVPEIPEAVTASELLSDTNADEYIKNARKMSKESYALAEAQQTMVKALAGDDGILYSDELVDMYDQWIEAGNKAPKDSDWTDDQIAGIQILDALINNFNTDIDTVKQGLIDVGLVSRSLSDITPFNLSSEATQDTVTKFEENIASIKEAWNALNDGSLTKSEFIELAMELPEIIEGVDLSDDNWMVKAKENLEELNQTKIDDFIDKLQQMKAAMKEDGQDTNVVDSFINYATQLKTQPLLDAEANTKSDTISGLKAEYESYIALVEEANEIIYDGQKISSDYYESLKEYIDDVEELDDCFDKNNKNIVTNAKKLKQLISQQKQETLNTVRLARAQSQLEYQDLVQELYEATNAYENNTSAGFDQINSLLQQIDTVQSTIDKYKLLELSLLGATNAFEEFQKAQEIDSETDYETSTEEMIQAMGEGFDSGKVGTHTFNAAIKGLLPENVYGDLSDSGDLDAVWKEFTKGNLSKFFTYSEDDGFDITLKNMKNFVAEAQKAGVLTGDSFEEFGMVADTSLKDFAEAMGLSEDATFAFLEMLSDYSIGGESLTSQLEDVKFDKDIEDATNDLDTLLEKKAEMLRSGKYDPADMQELNADIEKAQKNLDKANQAAIDHASQYTTLAALQNGLSGNVSMTKEQLDNLAAGLSEITGKTYTISADGKTLLDAEGNVVDIQKMLAELGEKPTVLEVQLAYKDMQESLDELNRQKELIEKDPTQAKIEFKINNDTDLQSKKDEINRQIGAIQEQMQVLEVQYDVQPPSEEDASIIEKFETLEKDGVKTTVTADVTEATEDVNEFRDNAEAPMETTLTVNTKTGTTTVTTDTDTEATVNFTVGTGFDDVLQKISLIKQATSVPIEQQVTVNDNGTTKAVHNQVADLNAQVVDNKTFEVSDNNTIEAEKIDVLDLDVTNIADKTFDVEMDGYTNVKSQLDTVISKLSTIDNMSATATVTVKTVKTEEGADSLNGNFHISGGAFSGGSVGAPRTEEALVGELGPELLVRGNRWTTIGENGAEFTQVKKGDIIFNHKQTEQLLKNGYITSRGKAYASGTAYNETYTKHYNWTGTQNTSDSFNKTFKNLSDAADKVSDAANDFRETFDWIEVRLEELEERFSLKEAKLENAVSSEAKNKIIDSMLKDNQEMYDTLIASADTYYAHANKILMDVDKIPAAYRAAAQNGAIAIEEFTGELGEEALNAIQEYREWAQKAADAKQQAEEKKTQAAALARQKFDNTEERWDLKVETRDNKNAKIEAAIDLAEAKGEPVSDRYYEKLIGNTNDKKDRLVKKRDAMQADLDAAVESGDIKKYSNDWYEMVAAISGVDEEIIQCDVDVEEFKTSINEIAWDGFDTVIERFENVSDEAQNLIDILSSKELVDDSGNWTNEGVASLGLYAQQMEYSKAMAQEYSDAIKGLETDYKLGAVSESEYAERLAKLKKGQYDSIKAYEDTKDAIVDLQKTRVEAIKKGIDKEVEAYEKLIKKKKEALDADKDAHDFAKSSMDHQKNIAELERKLAALAGDTSASAAAERARLNAELSEAKAEQEEFYYDRSVSNQQEAYDKELENFTETKEAEKEQWDEWLEDTSAVIGDAFTTIQAQAEVVNTTLKDLASEYGLELSNAITSPWENAQDPMNLYWDSFTTTGSTAITALKQELVSFQEALNKAEEDAKNTLNQQAQEQTTYTQAEYQEPQKPATNGNNGNNGNNNGNGNTGSGTPKVGGTVTVKKTATHFGSKSGNQKMASFVPGGSYTVYEISGSGANAQVLIGKNGQYTGWVKLSDLTGYSTSSGSGNSGSGTGTKGAPKKGASVTVKTSATNYSTNSGSKKMASFVPGGTYTVMETAGSGDKTQVLIGKNGTATGWVWLKDLKGYAKGTTGVKQSQLAWIDELGEELVMHADGSGKLSFLSKGSSVIPHDLTENLMSWGELDPSNMLESNRPSIGVSPEVHNTEINLDCSVGTLVNIERCEQGTLPDVEKMVNKAFEKHMSNLNNSLKKYVR